VETRTERDILISETDIQLSQQDPQSTRILGDRTCDLHRPRKRIRCLEGERQSEQCEADGQCPSLMRQSRSRQTFFDEVLPSESVALQIPGGDNSIHVLEEEEHDMRRHNSDQIRGQEEENRSVSYV
jgi:hypothetical protein